jgi:VanZ family protein
MQPERRLLAVVLVLVVYGSLYPFTFTSSPAPILAWTWSDGLSGVRDVIVNLAIYFPAGLLMWRRWGIAGSALICFAVSDAVEFLQAFDAGRVSSLPDLLCNTLGGALGAWAASHLPSRLTNSAVVVLLAVIARTFPFFPIFRPHWSSFQLEPAVFAAAEWMAVRCALSVCLNRDSVTRELALAQLVIPARVFLLDQASSWSEVAGALVALALPAIQPRRFAPVMLLSVIARELLPFHLSPAAQTFHWIPFETYLDSQANAVIFLGKLSLYLSTLWLLAPRGKHLWRYGSMMAVLIAALEWAQRWLPGRTPDISDALIVLLAAFVLDWAASVTDAAGFVPAGSRP